jgi:hypothetical protein
LTGIAGADFLKLDAKAKELDMGNAVTYIEEQCASMVFWNPSAIIALRRKEVSFLCTPPYYLGEFSYDCAVSVIPGRYEIYIFH